MQKMSQSHKGQVTMSPGPDADPNLRLLDPQRLKTSYVLMSEDFSFNYIQTNTSSPFIPNVEPSVSPEKSSSTTGG